MKVVAFLEFRSPRVKRVSVQKRLRNHKLLNESSIVGEKLYQVCWRWCLLNLPNAEREF